MAQQIDISSTWHMLTTANCQIRIGAAWHSIPYAAVNIGGTWRTLWGTPPAGGDFLQQEDATYILQETNDKIKLESSA